MAYKYIRSYLSVRVSFLTSRLKYYWSVSNFVKWNIQSLAKYQKKNYTDLNDNNIDKLIDHKKLDNILILKLK